MLAKNPHGSRTEGRRRPRPPPRTARSAGAVQANGIDRALPVRERVRREAAVCPVSLLPRGTNDVYQASQISIPSGPPADATTREQNPEPGFALLLGCTHEKVANAEAWVPGVDGFRKVDDETRRRLSQGWEPVEQPAGDERHRAAIDHGSEALLRRILDDGNAWWASGCRGGRADENAHRRPQGPAHLDVPASRAVGPIADGHWAEQEAARTGSG